MRLQHNDTNTQKARTYINFLTEYLKKMKKYKVESCVFDNIFHKKKKYLVLKVYKRCHVTCKKCIIFK